MSRINLLEETINILKNHRKDESDILWVGRRYMDYHSSNQEYITYKNTWEYFRKKANFYYDNGYGYEKVPTDLIVVGKDFWLERHSYDGSEWWEFKEIPKEPEEIRELDIFMRYGEVI